MDNFNKQIRNKYKEEFEVGSIDTAWDAFEKNNLPLKKKRRFGLLLFCGLSSLVLISLIFIGNNSDKDLKIRPVKANQVAQYDTRKDIMETDFLSEKQRHVEHKLPNHSPKPELTISKQNQEKESKAQPNELTERYKYNQRNTLPELKVENPKSDGFILKTDILTNKEVEDDNNTFVSNSILKELHQIDILQKYMTSLEAPKLLINIKPSIAESSPSVKKNNHNLSIGLFLGINTLKHRHIYQSSGHNLGLEVNYGFADRWSINSAIGQSKYRYITNINSQDLRIESVELRDISMKTKEINTTLSQFNYSLSIAYSVLEFRKLEVGVSAGVQSKLDIKEVTTYELITQDDVFQEVKTDDTKYRYPIYGLFSLHINRQLNNGFYFSLRPYFARQLVQSDLRHPLDFGVNAGLNYAF